MPLRQLIVGNWKMHGILSDLVVIEKIVRMVQIERPPAEILICPPATLIARAVETAERHIAIGGQNCHWEACGPFTGDISAEMLRDAGAGAVIVGHSERRQYHGETDQIVGAKALAAWRAGLLAIVCVGETEDERNAGDHQDVCQQQLAGSLPEGADAANTAVAYEPVWAIGTGNSATMSDIASMHAHIRTCLAQQFGEQGRQIRILYGGSVKPSNAREILSVAEVDGALAGGASLKAEEFWAIVAAARAS